MVIRWFGGLAFRPCCCRRRPPLLPSVRRWLSQRAKRTRPIRESGSSMAAFLTFLRSGWSAAAISSTPSIRRQKHGTFIAGLLVAGNSLNGSLIAPEPDGCEIYDGAIFPNKDDPTAFANYYKLGAKDFLAEISNSVAVAKEKHGVRIFNLSINVVSPVEEDQYGPFAEQLDAIADEHDVVFLISAGNLQPSEYRPLWPSQPAEAPKMLAARSTPETIYQPCESSRSLAVGALTPPAVPPHIWGTPACYSRRGPGMKIGVKPDLAHYGGCIPSATRSHCGLFSVDPSGMSASGLGTSYAAPLVAKTIAALDASIEGYVSREALAAL